MKSTFQALRNAERHPQQETRATQAQKPQPRQSTRREDTLNRNEPHTREVGNNKQPTEEQIRAANLKKAKESLSQVENGRDNPAYIAKKLYDYVTAKYPDLLNATSYRIFDHIRTKANSLGRFNTNHYAFANALGLTPKTVKDHLNKLLLLGVLRREDTGQAKRHYWFNYFLCDKEEQAGIEQKNSRRIQSLISKTSKGNANMKTRRESIKGLRNEVARLTGEVDQLTSEVKDCKATIAEQQKQINEFNSEEHF